MKAWLTIEPNKEEIRLLTDQVIGKEKGVSKTPLQRVIETAFCWMETGHEVTLKLTNMKYKEAEK